MTRSKNQKRPRRDYKAEYRRRIERGLAKGLSRQQARGHGVGSAPTKVNPGKLDARERYLERGIKLIKSGRSLSGTAKELRVAPERLQAYLQRSGIASKVKGKWRIAPDDRTRRMPFYSGGREIKIKVDIENASLVGGYLNDVGRFLASNEKAFLAPWVGKTVIDTKGRKHLAETDPNTLYHLSQSGRSSFEQIYRINI